MSKGEKPKYAEQQQRWQGLEDKADKLIGYLGGTLPVFSGGILVSLETIGVAAAIAAVPTIALLLGALHYALKCRAVGDYRTPPSIALAVSCHTQLGDESETAFIKNWSDATEALSQRCEAKADALKVAENALRIGAMTSLIPLTVSILQRFVT